MALGISLASIFLSLQLYNAGYKGAVLDADPALLAHSISQIMVISAILCLIVAALTLKR